MARRRWRLKPVAVVATAGRGGSSVGIGVLFRCFIDLFRCFFFEFSHLFGLFSNFSGLAFRELVNLSPKTFSITTTAVTFPVLEFSIAISLALIISSASLVALIGKIDAHERQ